MPFTLLSLSTHADGGRASGRETAEDIICSSARRLRLCYLRTQLYGGLISLCSAAPSLWSRFLLSCNTTSWCPCRSAASVGLTAVCEELRKGIKVIKDILCDNSNRKCRENRAMCIPSLHLNKVKVQVWVRESRDGTSASLNKNSNLQGGWGRSGAEWCCCR